MKGGEVFYPNPLGKKSFTLILGRKKGPSLRSSTKRKGENIVYSLPQR